MLEKIPVCFEKIANVTLEKVSHLCQTQRNKTKSNEVQKLSLNIKSFAEIQ